MNGRMPVKAKEGQQMRMMVLGLMLLGTAVHAGVCRPNGIDVSVRLNRGNYELHFPMSAVPQFATQQERDCMEAARLEYLTELQFTVGDLAPGAVRKLRDCRTLAYTRIEVIKTYRGATFQPKGAVWLHNTPAGRLYQCPGAVLSAFRTELMSTRTRVAAGARLASAPNLRNLLDVNATLTGPAAFVFPVPPKYDTAKRAQQTPVDTRIVFGACGGGDGCGELSATHAAHACRSRAKCGVGSAAACPDVQVAHVRYEAGCGEDARCQWFRRMHPFSGYQDPAWSAAQRCQIATLQDRAHASWMAAQAAGDAPRSEQANKQHDILHALENDATGWLVVFPWDGVAPDKYLAHQGNRTLSPQALLPMLVAAYGVP